MTTISENQAQFTCSVVGTGLVAAGTGLGGFLGGPVGATLMATLTGAVKATFTDDCTAYLTGMDVDTSYGPSYVPHNSTLELIGFSSRNWSPNKVGAVKLLDLGQSALDNWDISDLSGSVINNLGFQAFGTKWAEKIGGTIYSDKIYGQGGNDYLVGGKGNDTLNGGDGNDTLRAGGEADILFDGAGADRMWGGEGSDTFNFTANDGKADSIEDFVWDRDSAKGFGTVVSYKIVALGTLKGVMDATDNDGDTIHFTGIEPHSASELDTLAEVRAVVEHMLL